MRTVEIIVCSLAGGAVAAVLWRRARQRRPANPPPVAALASSAPSQAVAAPPQSTDRALRPRQPPLWIRLGGTGFAIVLVRVYWRHYGPDNFLWFSDLALFALCAALWFDNPLLVGMAAIGALVLEIAWSIDFLCGARVLHIAAYMFDPTKPRYLRALSLFHLAIPPAIVWLLRRRGYDRRSLRRQTAFAWLVMPATYVLTDPNRNINRVFGPGAKPQQALPPLLYLAALMGVVPLAVYLPTHLVLARVFPPPEASASETWRAVFR